MQITENAKARQCGPYLAALDLIGRQTLISRDYERTSFELHEIDIAVFTLKIH